MMRRIWVVSVIYKMLYYSYYMNCFQYYLEEEPSLYSYYIVYVEGYVENVAGFFSLGFGDLLGDGGDCGLLEIGSELYEKILCGDNLSIVVSVLPSDGFVLVDDTEFEE